MARRFVFSLDPLLTLRKKKEEEIKKIFAEATRAVTEEQERRVKLEQSRDETRQEIVDLYAKGGISFDIIRAGYRDINFLGAAIAESQQRQAQLEAHLDQVRTLLIEAQRERRAVEMLKEKRQEEFRAEMDRIEQAELDETSIRMHGRRLREKQ